MIIYPSYMEIIYNPLKTMGLDRTSDETGLEQKIRIDYGNLFDRLKQKQETGNRSLSLFGKILKLQQRKLRNAWNAVYLERSIN